MERRENGLLATAPAKAPKPRRKLQKSLRQQTRSIASRFSSSASNQAVASKTCDTTDNKPTPQASPHPSPAPSDTREKASSRREGRFYKHDPPFESLERLEAQAFVVPELLHLITADPQPQSPPSLNSTGPPRPKMRRRAKTPILSIGQLEDIPRPRNGLGRTSSVDLIAEQYKAVLESRRSSVYSDSHSEPPLSAQGSDIDEPVMLRRRRSSGYLQVQTPSGDSTRMVGLTNPSPTSDDGTLVSFQEETVYFKPVSFSPEPESPILLPLSRQTTTDYNDDDDNVGLQICLGLLTRELSSAIAGRPCRSSLDTSALQVWVMIEAYERLRDQMAELSHGNEQARSLEMMFDMWLRALHSIHDLMTGGRGVGDNDYGAELGTEELD